MTGPGVTAAMKAEDVNPALVEAACRARWDVQGSTFTGYNGDVARTWDALATLFPAQAENHRAVERHALAAVLPEIQAQALLEFAGPEGGDLEPHEFRDAANWGAWKARQAARYEAARLTATTEEPK